MHSRYVSGRLFRLYSAGSSDPPVGFSWNRNTRTLRHERGRSPGASGFFWKVIPGLVERTIHDGSCLGPTYQGSVARYLCPSRRFGSQICAAAISSSSITNTRQKPRVPFLSTPLMLFTCFFKKFRRCAVCVFALLHFPTSPFCSCEAIQSTKSSIVFVKSLSK
jgi:hypothetical protein